MWHSSACRVLINSCASIMQGSFVPLWKQTIAALTNFQSQSRCARVDGTWFSAACGHLATLGSGMLRSCVPTWLDAQLGAHHDANQSSIIELCLMFAVAWSIRGLQRTLQDTAAEAELAVSVTDSLKSAGFSQLPQGPIWHSTVDARIPAWVPWDSRSCLSTTLPISEDTDMAAKGGGLRLQMPTESVISQHALAGILTEVGGNALLSARGSCSLEAICTAVRWCIPKGLQGVLQRVSLTCSTNMRPAQVWVRPHLTCLQFVCMPCN